MNKEYRDFLKKVLELRGDREIRHRDVTTLIAMMQWIDFETENDVKNKRLANITDMDKGDVSKSVKSLIKANIIKENDKGYMLNRDILNEDI